MKNSRVFLLASLLASILLGSCSSSPPIKQEAYAKLSDHRTFELDFPAVWGGIENVFKEHVVKERDPEKVTDRELQNMKERKLKTDWAYTQSRDKYQEYKVNNTPRKRYLQLRVKYEVVAKAVLGGADVQILTTEEIEKLKPDGSSDGYSKVKNVDPSRPSEILEKINLAILSAQPDK